MNDKESHNPKNMSRREFVLATGVCVASAPFSCGRSESNPLTQNPIAQPKIAGPTHIRVRIGKKLNQVTVRNQSFSISDIPGMNKTVECKPDSAVNTGTETKKISGLLVLQKPKEDSTTFDVIAHIPLEQYLPGVLAGELFAHWHPTTFIAQAVAARSYATAQHLERKDVSYFDLDDNPSSQMYVGNVSLDVAHRATIESKGIVLTWNSEVFPAYYCACCGGTPALASDAISGAKIHEIPPLRGHDGSDICKTLDIHRWSANRASRTLRRRFNSCGKNMNIPTLSSIRSIRSIEPTKSNIHGRPTELTIYDRTNDASTVRASDFIRAVNASVPLLSSATPTIWSSHLSATKEGSHVRFEGFGMGHGVGLCQYGAQELAGKGETWEEILEWYYPSASLTALIG